MKKLILTFILSLTVTISANAKLGTSEQIHSYARLHIAKALEAKGLNLINDSLDIASSVHYKNAAIKTVEFFLSGESDINYFTFLAENKTNKLFSGYVYVLSNNIDIIVESETRVTKINPISGISFDIQIINSKQIPTTYKDVNLNLKATE